MSWAGRPSSCYRVGTKLTGTGTYIYITMDLQGTERGVVDVPLTTFVLLLSILP